MEVKNFEFASHVFGFEVRFNIRIYPVKLAVFNELRERFCFSFHIYSVRVVCKLWCRGQFRMVSGVRSYLFILLGASLFGYHIILEGDLGASFFSVATNCEGVSPPIPVPIPESLS